jgi:hypothetical protein
MLQYSDGRAFAQGACHCSFRPLASGAANRILVRVQVEQIEEEAAVDTGGVYLVCSQTVAGFLRTSLGDYPIGRDTVRVRGLAVEGTLHRVRLSLLAEAGRGESLDLEVTAFLPFPDAPYALPTMLGLTGCLECLRFAVDPASDMFYFGPLS